MDQGKHLCHAKKTSRKVNVLKIIVPKLYIIRSVTSITQARHLHCRKVNLALDVK